MKNSDNEIFTLTSVPVGVPVIIRKITDLNGYQSKLFEMGILPGVKIEVIKGRRSEIYLLKIQDSKLLLPEKIVEKIEIQPINKYNIRNGTMKIKEMQVGDKAFVVGYEKGSKAFRGKLLSMGLTKGTEFQVIKKAPLGDPIEIKVRGFNLSLRKKEAEVLIIEENYNAE